MDFLRRSYSKISLSNCTCPFPLLGISGQFLWNNTAYNTFLQLVFQAFLFAWRLQLGELREAPTSGTRYPCLPGTDGKSLNLKNKSHEHNLLVLVGGTGTLEQTWKSAHNPKVTEVLSEYISGAQWIRFSAIRSRSHVLTHPHSQIGMAENYLSSISAHRPR